MRVTTKLGLTSLLATVALASALSTASARSLSVSNQSFRVTWAPLSFTEEGFAEIRCQVTLEGSFHTRTIAKVLGSLIGYVTRANVNQGSCRESILGTAARAVPWNGTEELLGRTVGQSLPWHVRYEGFRGTLPNISGIILTLTGVRFTLNIPLTGCLATYGSATTRVRGTVNISAGVATTLTPGTERIPFSEGTAERCPREGGFSGNGTVTLVGNTTRISVTLI